MSKNNLPQMFYDSKDKPVGVFLPYKKFDELMDFLEDLYDYEEIQGRSMKKEKVYSLAEIKKEFNKKSKK